MVPMNKELLVKLGLQKNTTKLGTFHPDIKARLKRNTNKNGPVSEYTPSLGYCWLYTGAQSSEGYGSIYVKTSDGKNRRPPAHRVAYSLHVGLDVPANMVVRHLCHNKLCVRPGHLVIGTDADNANDRVKKNKLDAKNGKTPTKHKVFPKAKTLMEAFYLRVNKTETCHEWIGTLKHGYGQFSTATAKWTLATRWIYEQTFGPIPEGLFIMHKCDNRKCVRPDHLQSGTHTANMVDMQQKHRHGSFKLTAAEVLELRELYANGVPYTDIETEYGISHSTVVRIVSGETYGYMNLPEIERNRRCVLTGDQVTDIRKQWNTHTLEALAKMFGVSEWTIEDIIEGQNWKENAIIPTQQERDARAKLLYGTTKFTAATIGAIKKATGSNAAVGKLFGISGASVSRIKNGYLPNYLKTTK